MDNWLEFDEPLLDIQDTIYSGLELEEVLESDVTGILFYCESQQYCVIVENFVKCCVRCQI